MNANVQPPRIKSVAPGSDGAILNVTWMDGQKDTVDLSGWIATGGSLLAALLDHELFGRPAVVEHGSAVAWGDTDGDLAIDAFHLLQLATEQKPFDPAELVAWQRRTGLSNQEAKDFLGISLSTFNAYKAGARIPPVIGLVCRAAERDPLLMQAHYRPRRPGRPRRASHAA